MRLAQLNDFKVGDLVCYRFHDCGHAINLMAIVLECCLWDDPALYKIQFIADGSRMPAGRHELIHYSPTPIPRNE